ncbi:hypothetical protein HYV57_02500 [Candidatus Peregrinibacteria bacterium]|nr:hypothetical protein [Candidatus Peregrinibacteria bacterium]
MIDFSILYQKYANFISKIPETLRGEILLTGGAAAYLLGSDRPFSNDMDFMAPIELQTELEKALNISFTESTKKPVFHSFAGHMNLDGTDYDVVLRSTIQPLGQAETFTFYLTPEILKRRLSISTSISSNSTAGIVYSVPVEFLVLKKLLAGRGKEFGKYDLYDVHRILIHQKPLDHDFFIFLIETFCLSCDVAADIIMSHLEKIDVEYKNPAALFLRDRLANL